MQCISAEPISVPRNRPFVHLSNSMKSGCHSIKKSNNWVHANTNWKTFKHSCGAVEPFIPKFIEAGFDILNPVQVSAKGMDPLHLKKTYGNDIVFWGGGIDTQQTLPYGTPGQVRTEVLRLCEIFAKGGGLFLIRCIIFRQMCLLKI
jgi:hypothetical protein